MTEQLLISTADEGTWAANQNGGLSDPAESGSVGSRWVTSRRARTVVRDIARGSQPRGRFFVMLVIASAIAAFGLIANSTAVIIGAMLVSPLMTPIFGIALGMLRGNTGLFWRAVWSEALGIVLAIGSGYLIGCLMTFVATAEMASRTHPNLIDLLVAVFAGLAGSYALVDERVSPAMPGVAIATAIVPPLATCGLCLALGAWSGAGGAFLLFLANVVSILLVGLLVFWSAGLGRTRHRHRRMAAQLGLTLAAFAVVAVILTNSLMQIIRDRTLRRAVHSTLVDQLAARHGASLLESEHRRDDGRVQVLATVRSQRTIPPAWVSQLQAELEQATELPVDLVVRTIRSRDVSPLGSSLQAVSPTLDGDLIQTVPLDDVARETLASQVIREYFQQEPGFELTRVEYGVSPLMSSKSVVLAYVNAIRRLAPEEIEELEGMLQKRFKQPEMRFLIRVNSAKLRSREGTVHTEWANIWEAGPERVKELPGIETALNDAVQASLELTPVQTHFNWMDGHWKALVEVAGPRDITLEDVESVQATLPEALREDVEVLLWRRSDYIATSSGYATFGQLTQPLIGLRRERLQDLFHTQAQMPVVRAPLAEATQP